MKRNTVWNRIDKAGKRTFVTLSVVNALLALILGAAFSEMNDFRATNARLERGFREIWVVPQLLEQTGIETCLVKQVSKSETHFRIEADPSRYAEITEAFIPFLQEKTFESDARFVLEFDHDSETHGLTVCLFREESVHPRLHELEAWRTPAFWETKTPPQQ